LAIGIIIVAIMWSIFSLLGFYIFTKVALSE